MSNELYKNAAEVCADDCADVSGFAMDEAAKLALLDSYDDRAAKYDAANVIKTRGITAKYKNNTTQARCWFGTINFPQEKIAQYTNKGFLKPVECMDYIANMLLYSFKRDVIEQSDGRRFYALKFYGEESATRYLGINFEIGDKGTKHIHFILCTANNAAVRFKHLMAALYPLGVHLERQRGSWEANVDYVYKRGKHADKAHTLMIAPRFYGNADVVDAGKDNANDVINDMIDAGKHPAEIIKLGAKYAAKAETIRTLYAAKMAEKLPPIRDVRIVYFYGRSVSGKSFGAISEAERVSGRSFDTVEAMDAGLYMASAEKNAFDGYEYQNVVILDEFRDYCMPLPEFLKVTDKYTGYVSARYQNKRMAWSELYITSTTPPELLYSSEFGGGFDSREQVLRRIHEVRYCFVDPMISPDNEQHFCFVSVVGDKLRGVADVYKGEEQLQRLAEDFLRARHGSDVVNAGGDSDDDAPLDVLTLPELVRAAV